MARPATVRSVCAGDAPQHGVCGVFNTGGGLVEFSRSRRQHPAKHVAVGQPMLRCKNHFRSHWICSPSPGKCAECRSPRPEFRVRCRAARRPDLRIRPLWGRDGGQRVEGRGLVQDASRVHTLFLLARVSPDLAGSKCRAINQSAGRKFWQQTKFMTGFEQETAFGHERSV